MSGKIIDLFGAPVAERVSNKVFPPSIAPQSLAEYDLQAEQAIERQRQSLTIGKLVGIAGGIGVFMWVRAWRLKQRKRD